MGLVLHVAVRGLRPSTPATAIGTESDPARKEDAGCVPLGAKAFVRFASGERCPVPKHGAQGIYHIGVVRDDFVEAIDGPSEEVSEREHRQQPTPLAVEEWRDLCEVRKRLRC